MNACLVALGLYRSTGGPSKSVAAFQRALAADVISWLDPVEAAREPQIWSRCHVVNGSRLPGLRQFCYPEAAGLAEAERIVARADIVSCHSFWRWHNVWLQAAAARHRVPYWFVPHGALDPYVLGHGRLAKRFFLSIGGRRFLDGARMVVCSTGREYAKLAPLMPKARPAILPWPLDDADFRDRDEAARTAVRRRLGIPDDAVTLLALGRLHPMKRPLETIAAFAEGAPRDAHLLVVGNDCGVSPHDCERMAKERGVAGRVHAVGPAYGAERTGYLDAADAYLSLSHRENFNYAAAEALAAGLPVILSPGNDLGPELRPAVCGWLLDSLDDAAAAIAAATGLPRSELLAMGRRGKAWAEANLRYDVFAHRLRGFATELAQAR